MFNKKKKNSDLYEQYTHHGKKVWVIKEMKGKHRTVCLCFRCKKFNPLDRDKNCPVANMVYSMCVLQDLVLPVWECKDFGEK